jgi:TolB-like protein
MVAAPPPPTSAATATDHSIAVLPFVNMSPDNEQDYFADGISEELLNLLA